jgi:hypothetical protein
MRTRIDVEPVETVEAEPGVFVPRERNPIEAAVEQACDLVEGVADTIDKVRQARKSIRARARARRVRVADRILDADEV